MTNPLLNPQDDRFARPQLPTTGENPFKEPEGAYENPAITPAPKLPADTYETVYRHRGGLLAILAGCGLALQLSLVLMFFSFSVTWMLLALAGVVPALAACLLAAGDIRSMRVGAMDPSGLGMTRAAYWMGLTACILALLVYVPMLVVMLMFLF